MKPLIRSAALSAIFLTGTASAQVFYEEVAYLSFALIGIYHAECAPLNEAQNGLAAFIRDEYKIDLGSQKYAESVRKARELDEYKRPGFCRWALGELLTPN